jgi:hypothetical protein
LGWKPRQIISWAAERITYTSVRMGGIATYAKGHIWLDIFVRLQPQSSKYYRVFLWLRFYAFRDLNPYLTFCRGLVPFLSKQFI